MIGSVTFPAFEGGAPTVAVLDDLGRWACPMDAEVQRMLNVAFAPHAGYSVADGRFGALALRRVARVLGGKAAMEPEAEPAPPGRVY